jgi:hypothetical protein
MSWPITYINLEYRYDRRVQFMREFARFALTRFPAIRTDNPHGCALSHRQVILSHNFDSSPLLIVAEDDAVLREGADKLSEALQWLDEHREEWDIASLGSSIVGGVSRETGPFVLVSRLQAAHFIVYQRRILDFIDTLPLDAEKPYEPGNAYDQWLGRLPLRKLVAFPMLVLQRESYSDLAKAVTDTKGACLRAERIIAAILSPRDEAVSQRDERSRGDRGELGQREQDGAERGEASHDRRESQAGEKREEP